LRAALRNTLKQLDNVAPAETPSATTPRFSSSLSYLDQEPAASYLNQRRQSRTYTSDEAASNIDQVAAALESGEALDVDQIQLYERIINFEIDALTQDLKGKCTKGDNIYPNNLTISNHYEYIVLPTLVYELEYPRSEDINWYYVAEMKTAGMPLQERLKEFPWILSDLIFPFMMEYMMVRQYTRSIP
jgi:sterol O-acyltransferase